MNKLLRLFLIFSILLLNISCDQVSKHYVRNNFSYHDAIRLVSNHVTFTKVENTGAFLSLGADMSRPLKFILLEFLPIAFLVGGLVYMVAKSRLDLLTLTGLCFIIGGGAGNLFDRIYYGSVTDFMHIDFVIFETGVFNMADVSIVVGLLIMLTKEYLFKPKNFASSLN
jgi:signal peptidase II